MLEFLKIYASIMNVKANVWPLGQVVKTPPFHGGNMGSNPVGVTIKIALHKQCYFFSEINPLDL